MFIPSLVFKPWKVTVPDVWTILYSNLSIYIDRTISTRLSLSVYGQQTHTNCYSSISPLAFMHGWHSLMPACFVWQWQQRPSLLVFGSFGVHANEPMQLWFVCHVLLSLSLVLSSSSSSSLVSSSVYSCPSDSIAHRNFISCRNMYIYP